jgi:hypothetical protein
MIDAANIANLIYKDVVAARWFLLGTVPIYSLQLITLDASPPVTLLFTMLFSLMFASGSLAIDEVQGTEVTWCSLPVDRATLVIARYVTATLGILLGLGLSAAISGKSVGLGALVVLFFMLQSAVALFLPCYFRFGAGRGLMVFAVVMLAIVVAFAVAGAVLAAVTETDPTPDGERIAALEAWFEAVRLIVSVALVVTALAATAGSAALAIRWYAARDC